MRETVRENDMLGLFIEGTRQTSGVPGEPKPGAAMIAIAEGVPVVPAAIHGSQNWKLGDRTAVSMAFGERSLPQTSAQLGTRPRRRRSWASYLGPGSCRSTSWSSGRARPRRRAASTFPRRSSRRV
jgi:hypothetical protein